MDDPIKFPKGRYVGEKIQESTFGSIITSETVFESGLTSEWHFHENPHFSHILSGGSREDTENRSKHQYAGKGLYYFPGIPHQNVDYLPDTRIFNVELDTSFFVNNDINVPDESMMFQHSVPLNSGGLLRILKEHYTNDSDSLISIEQICVDLIVQAPVHYPHYPEWTGKVLKVINDLWNVPVSLAELAAQVEVHPVTLSKYFSKYFKTTLGAYFRMIKTERAISLIRAGKDSLTEIAFQCGFSDQAHFTKNFYAQTGMLPKQYRRM
jgi:AraC family transcriptional regulator